MRQMKIAIDFFKEMWFSISIGVVIITLLFGVFLCMVKVFEFFMNKGSWEFLFIALYIAAFSTGFKLLFWNSWNRMNDLKK